MFCNRYKSAIMRMIIIIADIRYHPVDSVGNQFSAHCVANSICNNLVEILLSTEHSCDNNNDMIKCNFNLN